MSSSESPSPPVSRRPSTGGQRTPGPPPAGPLKSRSNSRHRNPVGTPNVLTTSTGTSRPFTGGLSPRPPNAAVGQTPSPFSNPSHGALPSPGPGPFLGAQAGQSPASGPLLPRPHHASPYAGMSLGPGQRPSSMPHPPVPPPPPPPPTGVAAQQQQQQHHQQRRSYKRLILCCDGTWASADSTSSLKDGQVQIPSNVVHLSRAIKATSRDGVNQVVFYQNGVGTDGSILSRLVGGAVAQGLADNVLEAYYWVCNNWEPGDEIFLIGFSRGAFTARSIGGMIEVAGVLTREGIKSINIIFKDVENRGNPNYRSPFPELPFRNKPSANNPQYKAELERQGLSHVNVPIKAIAVFDTVGALGIPRVPLLERLGVQSYGLKEYMFFDTALGNTVERAFQALALDEQRAAFTPTLWEKPKGNNTDLRQVWFPGVHTSVGGGYDDANLSNITLAWMTAQLAPYLDIVQNYVLEQGVANEQYYTATHEKSRPWSLGWLYNSLTGIWILGGRRARRAGMFTRVTPTGAPTDTPLRQTNEYVHASARTRFVLDGHAYDGKGFYRPTALADYRLRLTGTDAAQGAGPVAVWESRSRGRSGPRRVLEEAPLFDLERRLLNMSPRVEHTALRPQRAEDDIENGNAPTQGIPGGTRPQSTAGTHRHSRHSRHRSRDAADAKIG